MWIEKDDLLRSSEDIGGGKLLTLHHLPTDVKMEVTIDKDGDPVGDILVYAVDGKGVTIDSYTYNSALDLEFWNATDKFESIIADMIGVDESSQTDDDDPKDDPKEVNALPQIGDYVEVKGKYGVVVSVNEETRGIKITPMTKGDVMKILREQKDQLIADTKGIGFRATGGNIDAEKLLDYNVDTDNVIILEVKPPQQKGDDKGGDDDQPEEIEKNKKDPFDDEDEQDNKNDSDKDGENDDGKDGGNDKDGDEEDGENDKDGKDKGGDNSGKDADGDDGKDGDSELQKSLDKFNKGDINEESERGLMSDFNDDDQDDDIFGGGGSDDVFGGGGSDDLKDDDLGGGSDLLDKVAKELSVDKNNLSGFNEWSALARGVGWSKVAKSLGTSVSELKEKLKVAVKQNK